MTILVQQANVNRLTADALSNLFFGVVKNHCTCLQIDVGKPHICCRDVLVASSDDNFFLPVENRPAN